MHWIRWIRNMQIKLRNRKCAWTKDGSSLVFSKHCFRGASFFPSILKPLHSTLNSLKATGSWKYIPRMKMHSNERPKVNASSIGRKTTNKITYGKCSLWWRSFFLFFYATRTFPPIWSFVKKSRAVACSSAFQRQKNKKNSFIYILCHV